MPGALTFGSGVQFVEAQKAYLGQLRAALDPSVPMHVTSGFQSVEGQVTNILAKYKSGGAQEILNTYGQKAGSRFLGAIPPSVQTWAAAFVDMKRQGLLPPGHTEGMAFDLRIKDLTEAQIQALDAAVRRTGGIPVREAVPPHMHVRLPPSFASFGTQPSQLPAAPPATLPGPPRKTLLWPFVLLFAGAAAFTLFRLVRQWRSR
jgi:hypothetical protein